MSFPKAILGFLILALETLFPGISIQQVKDLVRPWPQVCCGRNVHNLAEATRFNSLTPPAPQDT